MRASRYEYRPQRRIDMTGPCTRGRRPGFPADTLPNAFVGPRLDSHRGPKVSMTLRTEPLVVGSVFPPERRHAALCRATTSLKSPGPNNVPVVPQCVWSHPAPGSRRSFSLPTGLGLARIPSRRSKVVRWSWSWCRPTRGGAPGPRLIRTPKRVVPVGHPLDHGCRRGVRPSTRPVSSWFRVVVGVYGPRRTRRPPTVLWVTFPVSAS